MIVVFREESKDLEWSFEDGIIPFVGDDVWLKVRRKSDGMLLIGLFTVLKRMITKPESGGELQALVKFYEWVGSFDLDNDDDEFEASEEEWC